MSHERRERGAAALEMAIVLPLLLVLIGGIVDLGRLFFAEIMVTNAAREGARVVVMGNPSIATERARNSMPAFKDLVNGGNEATVSVDVACGAGVTEAKVTVSGPNFEWLLIDALIPLSTPVPSSSAVMRCGG
jgi:Flp pilus assembly protein TadG